MFYIHFFLSPLSSDTNTLCCWGSSRGARKQCAWASELPKREDEVSAREGKKCALKPSYRWACRLSCDSIVSGFPDLITTLTTIFCFSFLLSRLTTANKQKHRARTDEKQKKRAENFNLHSLLTSLMGGGREGRRGENLFTRSFILLFISCSTKRGRAFLSS